MNRELQLLEDMWMELHRQCNSIVNEYNYDTFKNIEKKLDSSVLEDIKAECIRAVDKIPITFSKNDADDCLKRDIREIFDKYISGSEG